VFKLQSKLLDAVSLYCSKDRIYNYNIVITSPPHSTSVNLEPAAFYNTTLIWLTYKVREALCLTYYTN